MMRTTGFVVLSYVDASLAALGGVRLLVTLVRVLTSRVTTRQPRVLIDVHQATVVAVET